MHALTRPISCATLKKVLFTPVELGTGTSCIGGPCFLGKGVFVMSFTVEQIALSTAEDERNYFSGSVQPEAPVEEGSAMPAGTYRVVNGDLYLVLPNAPVAPNPRRDVSDRREDSAT